MDANNSENVCKHFKFGYCKFQEMCRLKHVKEICSDKFCEITECSKRHPRECSYFRDYNRCKFGTFCFYRHEDKALDEKSEKIMILETKLDTLEKKMEDAEAAIDRLNTMTCCIEKLEKKVQEVAQNNFILIHAVDDIEKTAKLNEKNLDILFNQQDIFSCSVCEKEFESESLLRTHTESDHRSTKVYIKESASRSKSPSQTECCPHRCCSGTYSLARNCQGPGLSGQTGDNTVCCNHKLKRKS